MRVLVIGGTSFLGRHLVRKLAGLGYGVEATSRGGAEGLRPCDLTDFEAVRATVASGTYDAVVNCSGATATQDAAAQYRLHVLGSIHLVRAVTELSPSAHVLLLGSAAEYGRVPSASLPVAEEYHPVPLTHFAVSKVAQTELARVAARSTPLRITVLRPFNVVGPGLPAAYFASAFARRLREATDRGESGAMAVRNAGATRDFVDVRDVADAIARMIVTEPDPADDGFAVLNVASGMETPILDVAERLCRLAGPFHAVAGEDEDSRSAIDRSCGDAAKLFSRTGWRPTITWEESVAALWEDLAALR